MPGRDITRLRNRAARVLFLFTFVIWAGPQVASPAWSQTAPASNEAKPAATPPAQQTPATSQTPAQPPSASQTPPANTPHTQDKQGKQDTNLNDQGVFVFRKDV
ncbi:MAG TPA: hypothetical protein VFE61_29360, partial [Candidatus Sulfotelmatobacter sp.]|nr:hypothetical protein [Candidatus Sulfotelmatobacter sp.]